MCLYVWDSGIGEGITGLIRQPLKGLKKRSTKEFIKGIGRGIGGFFVKPFGGIMDKATLVLTWIKNKETYWEMKEKENSQKEEESDR